MADVFVSYSREDKPRVQPLVEAIEREGFSVWWDNEIDPGHHFDDTIDREIQAASCVVVVWSESSIGSRWVRNEALEGLDRDALVPVLLDKVRVPVAFRSEQTADFTRWPTSVEVDEYDHFVRALNALTGRSPAGRPSNKTLDSMKGQGRRRFRRKRDWLVPGLVAVVVALAASLFYFSDSAPEPSGPRLTVDRFSRGDGSDVALYADSMTRELQRQFSEVKDINLVQLGSVWDLEIVSVSETSLPDEVDYVLTGSVALAENQLTVDASLRDTAGNKSVIWKGSFSRDAADILDIQNQVVAAVMNELKLASTGTVAAAPLGTTTDKLAYRDYLIGQDLLRRGEEHHVRNAIDRFEKAVARDPDFYRAFAAICRANLELFQTTRDADIYESGRARCERLLELDSRNAEMHLALAELYRASGELEGAKLEYLETLAISPENADANMGLATIFFQEGDSLRAEEFYLAATKSNPTYWKAHNALATFYFRMGMYNRSIETFLRVAQLTTNNSTVYSNLGAARLYAGDFDGAFEAWRDANEIDYTSGTLSNMGTALYHAERLEESLAQYVASVEIEPEDHRLWGNAADVMHLIPGRSGQATQLYEKAAELAEGVVAVNPDDAYTLSRLAVYRAAIGEEFLARQLIERAESLAGVDFTVLYDLAIASKMLGDLDIARTYKSRALEAGYPEVLMQADPQLKQL